MLEQRVNFYQDLFRKPEVRFPFTQMLTVVVGILVLLLVLSGLDFMRTQRLREHVARREVIQSRLEASATAMTTQLEKVVVDPALVQKEQGLRDGLQLKYAFLNALKAQGDTHQVHFSAVLDGLANRDTQDIWLTRIALRAPTPELSLTGLASRAQAVPAYLDSLKEEAIFHDMRFRMLELERAAEQGRYLTFSVSTQHESIPER